MALLVHNVSVGQTEALLYNHPYSEDMNVKVIKVYLSGCWVCLYP